MTPSFDEISRATKSIKNNKSAGPAGIPGEVFKYGGHHVLHRLHKFICDIWLAEELPQKWKDATIVTIYKKKGDKSLCGNYRGISLLSVAGKLLAEELSGRIAAC